MTGYFNVVAFGFDWKRCYIRCSLADAHINASAHAHVAVGMECCWNVDCPLSDGDVRSWTLVVAQSVRAEEKESLSRLPDGNI